MACGLLVGICEFDQLWLAPGAAQQFHADRQPVWSKAARNRDRRQARVGAELAVAAHLLFADHVCLAADRRVGERIDPVVGHCLQDCFAQKIALDAVRQVFRSVTRFHRLGITQIRLDCGVEFTGAEHLFETVHRCARMRRQISAKIELEVLPQNQKAVRPVSQQLAQIGDRDIDDLRTLPFHLFDRAAHHRGHLGVGRVTAEEGTEKTDAGAVQAGQLQIVGIALRDIADARSGLRIGRVIADRRVEHDRQIGNGSGNRPGDVLRTG